MTTQTESRVSISRVVVLGANGAMGAGAAAMFAGGGCQVTLVARDASKTEGAITTIQAIAKSTRVTDGMRSATYDDMADAIGQADLIFEAVAEDFALKRDLLARVDALRPAGALVATVTSGLSIRGLAEGLSDGFRSHFAGIHLFNPPHMMTGTELIPHPEMDRAVVSDLKAILETRFGRSVIVCTDTSAFAGNRVGFKVLNEVAQLAEQHGVQFMDTLIGPYTGRAMAPLATVDLVGWDVHKAIVDNVYENTDDEAHDHFKLPAYMDALIAKGHLGDKTPAAGGFFRRSKDGVEVLDPASGTYKPADPDLRIPFVEEIRDLHHRGRYREGVRRFMEVAGPEADLARRVIFGYVSYALNRAGPGEVVESYSDIDRIMATGFNWAPPSAIVDIAGAPATMKALEQYGLPVPDVVKAAVKGELPTPLFTLDFITPGRYFSG